ncbi:hypothetical protein, partial [Enterococcus casseliflavus]|uniref:hypothetical protein n=1 Tax=Enterococcus casseliflavus TaxID=37734 RepID=UPI003D09973F
SSFLLLSFSIILPYLIVDLKLCNRTPIFILSVLSSLPKARLSKNKIFIVFRFSSVTDKTTQNKKDTREVSRIFYSAIAPFNGTKRFEFLL